jgi:hypothetical protein
MARHSPLAYGIIVLCIYHTVVPSRPGGIMIEVIPEMFNIMIRNLPTVVNCARITSGNSAVTAGSFLRWMYILENY